MPDTWGTSSTLVLHSHALVRDAQAKLLALAAASLLLLGIACANVANLLLTQWIRRAREFSVREALGAGRGRILRQIAAENLLLALAGAAAGLAVATALLRALPLLMDDIPRRHELTIDPAAAGVVLLVFLTAFTVLTILPIRKARRSTSLSLTLTSLQLALATSLLIGAGLMARTLWQLAGVESGVHASSLLTATVTAGPSRCATTIRCGAFLQEVNEALAFIPGVRSVNWSNGTPLVPKITAMSVDLQDHPRAPEAPAFVLWHATATPGYFAALGIPLRAGRLFTEADRAGALPVAVISESTARKFWPNQSPIGKEIRSVAGRGARTVVGVVADVAHYSLLGFPSWIDGTQYVPLEQAMPGASDTVQLSLFLETAALPPAALQTTLRQRFPDVVVANLATIREIRDASVSGRRSTAWLLALLSALGLLLGVVGVYGVLNQRAAQRTREIGIRLALGAGTSEIAGVVLREALWVSLSGAAAGVLAALALARFLRSLLYGVTGADPVAFLSAPALLILTALLAAIIPGLRAARTDPARTLRAE